MSLLLVLGTWAIFGRVIHKAHKCAATASGSGVSEPTPTHALDLGVRAMIPDTVPSDWIDVNRMENGG
jgi:hypothetical protein